MALVDGPWTRKLPLLATIILPLHAEVTATLIGVGCLFSKGLFVLPGLVVHPVSAAIGPSLMTWRAKWGF